MAVFNVHDAKTHLSRPSRARLPRGRKSSSRRVAVPSRSWSELTVEPRRPGRLKGRIRIGLDFRRASSRQNPGGVPR